MMHTVQIVRNIVKLYEKNNTTFWKILRRHHSRAIHAYNRMVSWPILKQNILNVMLT